ncbi:MAG: SMI1/KNR4 family protein [Planctomycetota bacterium]
MSISNHIVALQDMLDEWRQLGSKLLPNGVELIGQLGSEDSWMHAVYPSLLLEDVGDLEADLGRSLPNGYRTFLKGCGGLICFGGLFTLYPYRGVGPLDSSLSTAGEGLVRVNQLLSGASWMPSDAIAIATNALDGSVQVVGMGDNPEEVVRCDPRDGDVIERHEHVFACVSDRLTRSDRRFFPDLCDVSPT